MERTAYLTCKSVNVSTDLRESVNPLPCYLQYYLNLLAHLSPRKQIDLTGRMHPQVLQVD